MPGRHFEDFGVGDVIHHALRRTVTEADNVLFCSLTMNTQPLHLDEEAAKQGPFGQRIVNGLLTMALGVGISVRETTEGTLVANLGYDKVEHPKPVFHGDTLRAETKVVGKRRTSKPDRGLVELEHVVKNQRDEVVCQFRRTVLVKVRDPDKGATP
ncbi:MAG TPA: MaoC family dehydratase [Candidatus Thermoplasmatota archaeon]|jgi:acyl dehydratase|nr:MaoC family dehydratase [Candidatus Thermoplasmatota archaeon]